MSSERQQLRAFVAIHVPRRVRDKLREAQRELQTSMPEEAVRWTPFEQLHLTLEFLGNVAAKDIDNLQRGLGEIASVYEPFHLAAESVGAFSSVRNPRVIWAGIAGDVDTLKTLQRGVRTAVRPWIQEEESRAYHPHLTLGRARPIKPRELRKVSDALTRGWSQDFGKWRVDDFALMQSKLSPHGAQHSVLATFPLTGIQG